MPSSPHSRPEWKCQGLEICCLPAWDSTPPSSSQVFIRLTTPQTNANCNEPFSQGILKYTQLETRLDPDVWQKIIPTRTNHWCSIQTTTATELGHYMSNEMTMQDKFNVNNANNILGENESDDTSRQTNRMTQITSYDKRTD